MLFIRSNIIAHLRFDLFEGPNEPSVVVLYIGNQLDQWWEFESQQDAADFMADPLAKERQKAIRCAKRNEARAAELDAHAEAVASLAGCNSGRQIGPNRRPNRR